jgi:hypothetical protein
MNARRLVLVAALGLAGCSGSDATPQPAEQKAAPETAKADLHVAPAPRAKADGLPPPPAMSGAFPKPSKSWSELIVGKWLHVNRKDLIGDKVREFTRDGRVIERYSYPARPNHPGGIEVGTWEYRVEGKILSSPPSTRDDGTWVTEYTTFIETLTENELVTLTIKRTRLSVEIARQVAARRKIPVEQVLADVREERGRTFYVRLKDKDK